MTALVKDGRLVDDPFVDASGAESIPADGPVIVSLEQWQAGRDALIARGTPLGIRLRSDQHPEAIANDVERFAVIALEFPKFRDGRAYSYARLLRERYGYRGELRAVGDVLMEQLHFMLRVGFDAFEIKEPDPLAAYRTALAEFSVWYQPTGDGRPTAMQLRRGPLPPQASSAASDDTNGFIE
ncbi:MAG TPA: DUF934 domain-containing protein [Gammaproteobacteria bacterium]